LPAQCVTVSGSQTTGACFWHQKQAAPKNGQCVINLSEWAAERHL